MTEIKKICVFCGSKEGNDPVISDYAHQVGRYFAERDLTLVYGAAKIGIMGMVAESVLNNKGKVIGVIPHFLKKKEVVHLGLTQLITTTNMHERKIRMHEISDGFIAMPGGVGTLEELFEVYTWLQLGLHQKPIGLLNVNNFFDHLLSLLENMVKNGFVSMDNYELLVVGDTIEELHEKMIRFKAPNIPNWLNIDRT